MRRHTIALIPVLMALACSSSTSVPPGHGGGGGDAGGGPGSGPAGCSGIPSTIVGSCSLYSGGDTDAGTGGTLIGCDEYAGPDATQSGCSAGVPGYYGIGSSSRCPTANQLGGACVQNCGGSLVIVSYHYTTGPLTSAAQVQSMCPAPNDYVQ